MCPWFDTPSKAGGDVPGSVVVRIFLCTWCKFTAVMAERSWAACDVQSVLTYKHILEKSEYSLCLFCNKEIASRLYCLHKEINIRINIKSKI